MKQRKWAALLIAIAVLACFTTACQTATPPEASSSETSGDGTIKIGFNNLSTGYDYCNAVEQSLKENAEAAGIDLQVAVCDQDSQKALANADAFLMQECDIIIDFCVIPETGKAIGEKAGAKGVPVISIDVPYEGCYYFGCNNLESGKIAGKYAGERIQSDWGGKLDSLVLTYPEEAGDEVKNRLIGMRLGIEEVLGTEIPDEDVYFFDDQNSQPAVVKGIVTDFLTSHPEDKNVAVGTLDDPTALGAVAAIEVMDRKNDVYLISTGADPAYRDTVRKENPPLFWIGSVAYFPERYGEYLIPYAQEILGGENPPQERYMENIMITYDNIGEYYPE